MRIPTFSQEPALTAHASMTPMIDVVFQLLVYFLCTASFNPVEYELPANLPATGVGQLADPESKIAELEIVEVSVREPDGRLVLQVNGEPCADLNDFRQRLSRLAQIADLPVVLDIAPEVHTGALIDVYDACLASGLTDIRFATRASLR
jgi:biopolymer transport protein ExbD